MGKIKIIFFDIDGTLLRLRAKELSEKTVEALNRLKANGIRLCIATGRTPVSLPHFSGIEFDAFLTFNGSLCYNDTETIFSNPISPDDVQSSSAMPTVSDVRSLLPLKTGWLPMDLTLICRIITRLLIYN